MFGMCPPQPSALVFYDFHGFNFSYSVASQNSVVAVAFIRGEILFTKKMSKDLFQTSISSSSDQYLDCPNVRIEEKLKTEVYAFLRWV